MPKKILVVEDHAASRELLVLMLRRAGYEVAEAASGEEGIEKAVTESPDLIIMDLNLPGISGIEATIKLKQHPQAARIPVIAHTASSEEDRRKSAEKAGMAWFLTKPVPYKALVAIVNKFLPAAL